MMQYLISISFLFFMPCYTAFAQSFYHKPYSKFHNVSVSGQKGIQKMINNEFVYPISAIKKEVEGVVVIGFTLNPDGKVTQLNIKSTPNKELNQEALKLFKKIQWTKNKYRPMHTETQDVFTLEFSLKKWVKLYKKRGYKYINYPFTPIDTSQQVYFIKATTIKPIPIFKDGNYDSFNHYIFRKMRYPEAAKKLNLKGEVLIAFIIEPSGKISNIEVIKNMNGGCTQEALRLINEVQWLPGQHNNMAVRTQMLIAIGFGVKSNAFYETFNQGGQGNN